MKTRMLLAGLFVLVAPVSVAAVEMTFGVSTYQIDDHIKKIDLRIHLLIMVNFLVCMMVMAVIKFHLC